MRVNVYAEEMTDRLEIIGKEIDGNTFTGLRFYLELPATVNTPEGETRQVAAPFMHRPGDDDSAAVTFWGKRDLRILLRKALSMLDYHYDQRAEVAAMPSKAEGRIANTPSTSAHPTPAPVDLSFEPLGVGVEIGFGPSATPAPDAGEAERDDLPRVLRAGCPGDYCPIEREAAAARITAATKVISECFRLLSFDPRKRTHKVTQWTTDLEALGQAARAFLESK